MKKCDCYRLKKICGEPHGICIGTRECEECYCDGNEARCTHYPEKREKANNSNKLNTAEMWLAAQQDDDTYIYESGCLYYSKRDGITDDRGVSEDPKLSLNSWMNMMWERQERRKMTVEEAEKEFRIKIVD